jgi:hypothetical protein
MFHRNLEIPDIKSFSAMFYSNTDDRSYEKREWLPHINDALEIYALIEGDVSFAVEGSRYDLLPGDVIITKPNEIHNCILNSNSVHKHVCFWFDTSNVFLFESFLKHELGCNNLIRPDDEAKKRLNLIYEEMVAASDENDIHKEFYLSLEMLHILKKFITDVGTGIAPSPILSEIIADMNLNFKKIRNLDYFTVKYYISPSTLNRLFKSFIKTTPKTYLETKKLSYSRMLLMMGKSVSEAALESGFDTSANYIRTFKRRFGITPKQYTRNQKKSDFI